MEEIRKGDRFRIKKAFTTHVLTMWKAPFTDGFECELPEGLEFLIDHDPLPKAKGVAALPDPYRDWEKKLVSQTDLCNEKYNGYYFVATFEQLKSNCERC